MPPLAATQAAARLWTARVACCSFRCFWCSLLHRKCDQAKHLVLPPSHCKPVPSSIPIHNNPVGLILENWMPIVGTATVDPLPREKIVQEISNFSEEWGGAPSCWKYIRPLLFQESGQFLLQKSEVRLSCKTTFQDERANQLIVQNCTPHIDTKT